MCIRDSIVRGMQLVRSASLKKAYGFSSLVRNASFSRGWLHLVVQSIFAMITVASFILILLMAIQKYPVNQPVINQVPRCHTKSCVIYCNYVPDFGEFEEDIVNTVSQLSNLCPGFYLALHKPMFVNETLPTNWLPRLRLPLTELAIIGGNLMHFPPDAFLTQVAASIKILVLHGLVIKTWTRDSLVGLTNLVEVYVSDCTIVNIQPHVFRSVHDTLESLTIIRSEHWDPKHFTGTTNLMNLATVDFSNNVFNDILRKDSFTGLKNCKILYLNSCNISAIGLGAFDHLHSIEMLFLNNNLLVTVPVGLFSNIIRYSNVKPRINLQDNLWNCNCWAKDIRQLIVKDMLLTDPTCNSPERYKGKTFFELESYCYNSTNDIETNPEEILSTLDALDDISGFVYINNGCYNGNLTSSSRSLKMLSPVYGHKCSAEKISKRDIQNFLHKSSIDEIVNQNSWVKFTFLLKTRKYSIVQLGAIEVKNYGLLWYQSTCPNEVYCVDLVPSALRVYNVDMAANYIFCPILLSSGVVESEKCISYNLTSIRHPERRTKLEVLFYICTGASCLLVGALCVYALIRKNPNLLKGNKRILFVKHKTVDAIVLPPAVAARNDLVNENTDCNKKKIFIVPANPFDVGNFNRNKSTRSTKSSAPSYISALQPTEEQLAEWRIRNHFANDLTSEFSTYSWICSTDSSYYTNVIDNDKTYESLK